MAKKKRSSTEFKAFSKRFGSIIRQVRQRLAADDRHRFSLRSVAGRLGMEPSYLSRVERGIEPPPSERMIIALARELNYDPDELLLLAGRFSSSMAGIFARRSSLNIMLLKNFPQLDEEEIVAGLRQMFKKAGKKPIVPIPDRFGRLLPPEEDKKLDTGNVNSGTDEFFPPPITEVEGQSGHGSLLASCQRCGALTALPAPLPKKERYFFACSNCGSGNSLDPKPLYQNHFSFR